MIIYWETLEHNAGDPATIPDYIATDYFGGIGRINADTSYPVSPSYGTIRYRTDFKRIICILKRIPAGMSYKNDLVSVN